ncbi:3-isopropylmalate dehydrogenase [Rhodospirillaceae bacterium KN72]|uniref:3-isopropylmalate dehydrogenase n=1 Tax=Pacificispira spongiicola TaxID=2729598 RepID=A0A7Y0DZS5_9PROT|nr:3-isopropylmalate dehydrogenase [Pacificispira spongiicola]NMM44608.1 3-isopropylmalate dehydrogenase [Pacificispira spongiicola]
MASNKTLLMLPGDGIGPEVCDEVRKVVDWMDKRRAVTFDIKEDKVGGAAYDAYGTPLTDDAMDKAQNADAVLFGAVGGPQYDNLGWDARPEAGLLRLRKEMDLFANLRPAVTFDALLEASTLKPEVVQGLDIMIVRELTAGVYFGEPRGMQMWEGKERCIDTQSYTRDEIVRVAEVAFDLARKRNKRVASAEKANVMKTGVFWRQTVAEVHKDGGYDDIELSNVLADNCAMQLVRNPKQFDVIVTDNLFGDLLSDVAAMLTGSLGMLPSASLGAVDEFGRRKALYEPVHGSAPDIAGQGKANPMAMLLSFAMALRYSFDLGDDADLVEQAAQAVLSTGKRTLDIMSAGCEAISTSQMGDAVIAELDKRAA